MIQNNEIVKYRQKYNYLGILSGTKGRRQQERIKEKRINEIIKQVQVSQIPNGIFRVVGLAYKNFKKV